MIMSDYERLIRALEAGTLCQDRILELAQQQMFGTEDVGMCLECGHEQHGVEPDARDYACQQCGTKAIFGAQELMMTLPGWTVQVRSGMPLKKS
jgi:DNA-directed RNA polymerase subunit RPC12/RpoP